MVSYPEMNSGLTWQHRFPNLSKMVKECNVLSQGLCVDSRLVDSKTEHPSMP